MNKRAILTGYRDVERLQGIEPVELRSRLGDLRVLHRRETYR